MRRRSADHQLSTAAALAGGALAGVAAWRLRARRRASAQAGARRVIHGLQDATFLDPATGAVRSVQKADLLIDAGTLAEIWTPAHLERLARSYWRFLGRVTLGLIRVRYDEHQRAVTLLISPLRLLTFRAPEYELGRSHGLVRWRIDGGLLVARRGRDGRGYLQIEVRRGADGGLAGTPLHVEVEVANFYPAIASAFGRRLYSATQSRIHVLITNGFLRSLARGDLARSQVRRFSG